MRNGATRSTGLVKVRGCCLFAWHESAYGHGSRVVEVGPEHCAPCVEALGGLVPPVRLVLRRREEEATA